MSSDIASHSTERELASLPVTDRIVATLDVSGFTEASLKFKGDSARCLDRQIPSPLLNFGFPSTSGGKAVVRSLPVRSSHDGNLASLL